MLCITYSLQVLETWGGTVYLQSMIMVRVSLSLASWKGGWPQTNMNSITPRLQISEEEKDTRSDLGLGDIYHGINRCNITRTFINTSISQTQIWRYAILIHSRVLPTTDVSNVLLNYICPLGLNPRLNNHTKPSYDIMIWIIFKN